MYGFMDGNDGIGCMKWRVWYFSGRGFFLCHWVQLVEEGCGLYAGGRGSREVRVREDEKGNFTINMIYGWREGLSLED